MKALKLSLALLALLAAMTVFALPASAGGKDTHQITIIDEDGVTYICKYDEDTMRVFNKETGEEVVELDFREVEAAIDDAMDGVEKALETAFESLADLDLDLHFGDNDNHFNLDLGDEDITIDFDELFASIGRALEEIDFEGFQHVKGHSFRIDSDDQDTDALITEIDSLKAELKKLKKELKKKDDFEF